MTPVILESTPHKTQEPQDSLPLTPRLPIEGKPGECKQEEAVSIVTATRTNGMAKMAKPTEMVADIDRTALLDGEPAETACGVDEGDEMGHKDLQLPKAGLYCEERHQCNENMKDDIPSAYGMPLEGEWVICASGEVGCSGGIVEQAGIDEAEALEPVDTPDESDTLVIVSIEPDAADGADIPCVYLGGTSWQAGDANCCGNQADGSRGLTDVLRGLVDGSRESMDPLGKSKRAEMAMLGCGDRSSTYLGPGDAKRVIEEMDGVESHADMSTGHEDIPNVETNVNRPAKAPDSISIPRKWINPPDLPSQSTRTPPDEPDGCGNLVDTSSVHTVTHSVKTETETAENRRGDIRTG